MATFQFLAAQTAVEGEVLSLQTLRAGFTFEGQRVPLMGPQGIFKPALIRSGIPLSITTVPVVEGRERPYEDEVADDGLLHYRYRGTDPRHRENVGLREAMTTQTPLVYFHGIVPSQYLAQWPVYIVGDDPASLTFTVAVDDPAIVAESAELGRDEPRRQYVTRLVRQRIHQVAFRTRVIRAYQQSCAVCRLGYQELLDAAHILPDTHPSGEPVVANGLALCKLHHAAFDRNIIGVRPDLVVEVRRDVLDKVDGPMLRHGLQDLQGARLLVVPRRRELMPSSTFLAERYESFRAAG
jgi:putative restriction endonuclease